jgi:hypothetical protein
MAKAGAKLEGRNVKYIGVRRLFMTLDISVIGWALTTTLSAAFDDLGHDRKLGGAWKSALDLENESASDKRLREELPSGSG